MNLFMQTSEESNKQFYIIYYIFFENAPHSGISTKLTHIIYIYVAIELTNNASSLLFCGIYIKITA